MCASYFPCGHVSTTNLYFCFSAVAEKKKMSGAIKQSDKSQEPGGNAIVMTDF